MESNFRVHFWKGASDFAFKSEADAIKSSFRNEEAEKCGSLSLLHIIAAQDERINKDVNKGERPKELGAEYKHQRD